MSGAKDERKEQSKKIIEEKKEKLTGN